MQGYIAQHGAHPGRAAHAARYGVAVACVAVGLLAGAVAAAGPRSRGAAAGRSLDRRLVRRLLAGAARLPPRHAGGRLLLHTSAR